MNNYSPQHYPLWAVASIPNHVIDICPTADDFRQTVLVAENGLLPEPVIGWHFDNNGNHAPLLAETGIKHPLLYADSLDAAIEAAVRYYLDRKTQTDS